MSSEIKVSLAAVKMLAGVQGIDVLVDGEPQASLQFGETTILTVAPGRRAIQVALRAVFNRTSNVLPVTVAEGERVMVVGKYSRLWGSIKLKLS